MASKPQGQFDLQLLLKGLVLAGWGIGFMWLLSMGRYQYFIRPSLVPLIVGSLVMTGLFLMALSTRRVTEHVHHHGAGHPIVNAAILLLPLAYMVAGGAAAGLDSYAFQKRYVGLDKRRAERPAGRLPPLIKEGRTPSATSRSGGEVTLLGLAEDMDRFAGQDVTIIGRVFRHKDQPADECWLFRFAMICCAADAIPIGAVVRHPRADALERDAWVRVRGRVSVTASEDGTRTLGIRAEQLERIDQPRDPYMYPRL